METDVEHCLLQEKRQPAVQLRREIRSPHRLSPECRLQILHHLVPHLHFLLVEGEQSLHLYIRGEISI